MFGGIDPGAVMRGPDTAGRPIALTGGIFDGAGASVTDAMVEAWQADGEGRLDPGLWGRQATDADGRFRFDTVKPGAVNGAPHVALWIVARGINLGLHTRAYFPDEAAANAADPVLRAAGERAATLISRETEAGYHLDIQLQGVAETVFLDP
jgi:protocatechuate 3,4-dioxygenase alpha subunit